MRSLGGDPWKQDELASFPVGPTSGQHPAGTSHSITANAANNFVFVALPANNAFLSPNGKQNCLTGCVAVFTHGDEDTDE